MFSTAKALGLKFAGLLAALPVLLLTGCDRNQLSLPVAQAAASPAKLVVESLPPVEPAPAPRKISYDISDASIRQVTEELYRTLPSQSCYAFMLRRPRAQRADAVQARLAQADRMSAALDSDTFSVDLVGDHANVLSLEFPVEWPATPEYSNKVSSVIVDYLSVPDIQDYLCNSGFSEVKLSARGVNDHVSHLLWTAQVTSEGLMKKLSGGRRERLAESIEQP